MSNDTSSHQLDLAIKQARLLEPSPQVALDKAREAIAIARLPDPKESTSKAIFRFFWPLVATAACAASVFFYFSPSKTGSSTVPLLSQHAPQIVQVGNQVALLASSDAHYSILHTSSDKTLISLQSGRITARLYHANHRHTLRIVGEGLEVEAVGTIYSVFMHNKQLYTVVHEGKVILWDALGKHELAEGAAFPPITIPRETSDAASALRIHLISKQTLPSMPPTPQAHELDAGLGATPLPGKIETPEEEWRRARLLRGQGRYQLALRKLRTIINQQDPTWAPIAIVESMRIHASALSNPAKVIQLGKRFQSRFARHSLAAEVSTLQCRAYQQLETTAPTGQCQ